MEDSQIIALYFSRDESAISETQRKFGAFLQKIARSILKSPEDCSECVNDAYYKAWNSIPPNRPENLSAYLGRIVRNTALDRYKTMTADRRNDHMVVLLGELEDCVPARSNIEQQMDADALSEAISRFLRTLSKSDRILFVRRYWYGLPVEQLAKEAGIRQGTAASTLFRIRKKLRTFLEKEAVL